MNNSPTTEVPPVWLLAEGTVWAKDVHGSGDGYVSGYGDGYLTD